MTSQKADFQCNPPQCCADAADAEQALGMGMDSPECPTRAQLRQRRTLPLVRCVFKALQEAERPSRRVQYLRRQKSSCDVGAQAPGPLGGSVGGTAKGSGGNGGVAAKVAAGPGGTAQQGGGGDPEGGHPGCGTLSASAVEGM